MNHGTEDKRPRVVVLLCTYNGERFLEKQLESIYRQTRPADSVLIADDNSHDCTRDILRRFISRHGLNHWELTVNRTNQGWRRNFLGLMARAEGDVIMFSDQDDVWLPDRVERTLAVLNDRPGIHCLVCRWQTIDEEDRVLGRRGDSGTGRLTRQERYFAINAGELQSGCLMAYRGMLNDLLRGPVLSWLAAPGPVPAHDVAVSRYAFFLGGLYCIDESWHLHRFHQANASVGFAAAVGEKGLWSLSGRQIFCKEVLRVLESLAPVLTERGIDSAELARIQAWNMSRLRFMSDGAPADWLRTLRLGGLQKRALLQAAGDFCYRFHLEGLAGRMSRLVLHLWEKVCK